MDILSIIRLARVAGSLGVGVGVISYILYKIRYNHSSTAVYLKAGLAMILISFGLNALIVVGRGIALLLYHATIVTLIISQLFFVEIALMQYLKLSGRFEGVISKRWVVVPITVAAALALSAAFIIPGRIRFDAGTDWKPVIPFPAYAIYIFFITPVLVVPTVYFSLKTASLIEDEDVKRGWNTFMTGFLVGMVSLTMTATHNLPAVTLELWPLANIPVLVLSYYMMYWGLARHFKKDLSGGSVQNMIKWGLLITSVSVAATLLYEVIAALV
jgi:hypothetical protein